MQTTADLDLPPHDPARILAAPFPERVRLLCRTWASQAHATPFVVSALYWVKYLLLYIGGWAFFVSFSKGSAPIGEWAFSAAAFQKAVLWSIFYELAGFGCGMGPST